MNSARNDNSGRQKDILLEAKNLKKHFPVQKGVLRRTVGHIRAVDGVSFAIERGTTLGLVGETGCGKTTVGRLLLRLIPADAGEVRFEGKNLLALNPGEMKGMRRHLQIVFQDPFGSLNPRMKVGDLVAEGLTVFQVGSRREIEKKVLELIEIVGLPPGAKDLYPHEFSGGQRQRIGIARAIALNPKFIICDEPVSSLDVSIQAQILNLLSDLQDNLGLTYLFIAHDLSVVEHISERVAVMYLGRLVEVAARRELYDRPLHPYTRVLLDSIPVPDPEARFKPHPPIAPLVASPDQVVPGCRFFPRCPLKTDSCREETPELEEVSPGHSVACFRSASTRSPISSHIPR